MSLPHPFPSKAPFVALVPHPDFQAKFTSLQADHRFAHLGVAVVHMGLSSRHSLAMGGISLVGGWNLDATRYSASLVKIAAMFAAFRLRDTLRVVATPLLAGNKDDLIKKITADWTPMVQHIVANDFPDLKKVFSIGGASGAWTFDFESTFQDKMELMIDASDNHAASYCILALGYQYINAALAAEGLYSNASGGLWLAGDYAKGRDGKPEPKSRSHQAASPSAVARFLTLLETNRLVNATASGEMRALMRNHYMRRFLTGDGRSFNDANSYGKLGIGGKSSGYSRHDCAVIDRTPPHGSRFKYALVMLGGSFNTLEELALEIDNLMP